MPTRSKPIILAAASPLGKAVEIFKNGGVVAYPTETFYGLGVDPFNEKAVKRLFSLKGREKGKPVSLIIKDRAMLDAVAEAVPPIAERLMKKYWPGPLTIIFKASRGLPSSVTGSTGTIGVRVSSGAAAKRLMNALSSPLTATSANPSGSPASASAGQVVDYFNGNIDLLIDGGTLQGSSGSTIVDVTGDEPRIVREGEVPSGEILRDVKD
ncbi:MAG: threonylcarbamoyl-AMP synthase [Deltaproteobacteria bacterium]|nr:threonylcarbamoyl-AMP synthase [Deltaproteobacteria bacterium]